MTRKLGKGIPNMTLFAQLYYGEHSSSKFIHIGKTFFTFSAIPIIARGKPYVNIKADHSDPGKRLKYAPKP